MKKTVALIAVVLAGMGLADSASAAKVVGSVKDSKGDGAGKSRDLVQVRATYDNVTGAVSFRIKLAGAIRNPKAQVTAGVGKYARRGGCRSPIGVLGANFPGTVAVWQRDDDGKLPVEATGLATVSESGSVINLRTKQATLQGLKANCAQVIISNPKNNAQFDDTKAFRLRPQGKQRRPGRAGGPQELRGRAGLSREARERPGT